VRLSYLWRGLPGHPIHPPLTDATIGIYTFATIAAFGGILFDHRNLAEAWWLALVIGLVVSVPTIATGFADWLTITAGTPLWRTATGHMIVNSAATVAFLLAVLLGHGPYHDGAVTALPFALTLLGFLLLALGGWIGGTITYVHGMRVLGLPDEPAAQAVAPVATPEGEEAAGEG
jgi:uncharacterized membrane protein